MDLPIKDVDHERPIPAIWRQTILALGDCLKNNDYGFETAPKNVNRLDPASTKISKYQIEIYNCGNVTIDDLSWESSIYIWMGNQWELIIDLIDENGSLTDLVLKLVVKENGKGYIFLPDFIHVP